MPKDRKITKKLILASEILGSEQLADDPEFVLNLFRRDKVDYFLVYSAMAWFGYRWDGALCKWKLVLPPWLDKAIKDRDKKIMEDWK